MNPSLPHIVGVPNSFSKGRMFTVRIAEIEDPITVEMGETILQAALRQGVAYPCGCQAGNCGACKSRLIGGEVEMSPYSEYALSEEEKADGKVLACRAVPWSDAEIAWLDPAERRLARRKRRPAGDAA
jgi:CDP-4-dehydro-6-deoxyglucose reductase/ferredoxin-NAD(P)+ reductase (naphthalene dioxygenase ferredoxin-specific)